jgi:PAS domain S-box-containing protein
MIAKNNVDQKTILLVDDEIIFAKALSKKMQTMGYNVIITNSGEEAIELTGQTDNINLVLMEIDLGSDLNGIDVASQILLLKKIPIVFHASHFEKQDIKRLREISRYGFVIKNSSDFVLQSSLEMAFELFEANERLRQKELSDSFLGPKGQIISSLDHISDSVVSLDNNWKYTYANESALSNFGVQLENLIGRIFWEVFPEVIGTVFLEKPRESMTTQLPVEFEGFYETYQVWVHIRCYPAKNGLTMFYQDITTRKENDKKAKDTSKFLNSIIENIPNMIFMKHANDLRFVLFNRAGENLIGYDRKDLLGKNDYDFFPKEQADFFTQKDRDVLKQTDIVNIPEEKIDTPHGTRILHTRKLPLFDERGQPEYLLGISEDITQQKESEKKIKENIERYDRLTKTIPGALYDYVLHKDGRSQMIFISSKCIEIFEVEADIIIKDMSIIWEMIHPDDFERFRNENEFAVRFGNQFHAETRIITPSGKEKWVEMTSRPNPVDNPDEPVIWSGFAIDITHRKLAEEKIKTLLDEKELLLREVHHRIKNNMLTITSLLFLQTESLQDSAAISALNDAVSRIQSMVVLYDKLYRSSNFNELSVLEYLSPLVDEIVNNFPNYQIVKIEKVIEDFILPTATLFPIGIMINELLTNAMKYAFVGRDSGLLKVSAYKAENRIYFSIEDDGVGMPESDESIAGFGLQLVNMLAKQIRGVVRLQVENGTKFTLEFGVK